MKTFAMTLTAAGMVLGTALPVPAQTTEIDPETLTCAQFMALSQEDQGQAVLKLQEAKRASGEAVPSASTDAAPPPVSPSGTESGASAVGDHTGGDSTGSDPDLAALENNCTGKDAMLAKDLVTIN